MFEDLAKLRPRPRPYAFYTARDLWNDPYVSRKMLEMHLDETGDRASRNGPFVRESIDWMAERFNVGAGMRICDFGCGPGLYTTPFAEMGADVTGIDFSERSIRYARDTARQRKLEIDYICRDYLAFTPPKKFHLLTLIFVDLCALSPKQRQTLYRRFDECLEEGGRVFLDVLSLTYFDQVSEESLYECAMSDGFWSSEPHHVFVETFKYDEEKVLLDRHTVFEEGRTREIYNWLQCYSLESLSAEVDKSGFQVVEHYADVAGSPYDPRSTEFAVVLERT